MDSTWTFTILRQTLASIAAQLCPVRKLAIQFHTTELRLPGTETGDVNNPADPARQGEIYGQNCQKLFTNPQLHGNPDPGRDKYSWLS
jgi:hypothetical protein